MAAPARAYPAAVTAASPAPARRSPSRIQPSSSVIRSHPLRPAPAAAAPRVSRAAIRPGPPTRNRRRSRRICPAGAVAGPRDRGTRCGRRDNIARNRPASRPPARWQGIPKRPHLPVGHRLPPKPARPPQLDEKPCKNRELRTISAHLATLCRKNAAQSPVQRRAGTTRWNRRRAPPYRTGVAAAARTGSRHDLAPHDHRRPLL